MNKETRIKFANPDMKQEINAPIEDVLEVLEEDWEELDMAINELVAYVANQDKDIDGSKIRLKQFIVSTIKKDREKLKNLRNN